MMAFQSFSGSARHRRQRTVKEDPNMTALPGTRTLQSSGHVELVAGLQKSEGIILPRLLVEVRREEPARFVRQQGVHADGLLAQEVVLDGGVGQRDELSCLLIDFLPLLRAASVDRFPVLHSHRHVTMSAIGILPSPRVDIFSPAKQVSK